MHYVYIATLLLHMTLTLISMISFKQKCMESLNKWVPSKYTSVRFHQPWINTFLKRLCRRKQRYYNAARRSRSQSNWLRFKQFKKYAQQECKKAYNNYLSSIVSDANGHNPKRLWSFIRSKRVDNCGISALNFNGQIHSENHSKSVILNNYFHSVFTKDTPNDIPVINDSPYPSISDISVTLNGVSKLLKSLKQYKVPGPDLIPNCLLKEAADEIAPVLTLLFQTSIKQSKVLIEWKHAHVTPIFKQGDCSSPTNYRPVSLTCVCSKLLEHVYSAIMKHLNAHSILADAQHGFRQGRSCESQLLLTVQDIASALDNGRQVDVIALDFTKAF